MTMRQRMKQHLARAIDRLRRRQWRRLERIGWHVTPNHFYQPIPDTRRLADDLFTRESPLHGIELHAERQKELLARLAQRHAAEYNAFPMQPGDDPFAFHDDNPFFNGADAAIYHGLVRELKPRRVIEVGSGYSTRVAAAALRRNAQENPAHAGRIVAIEPWPDEALSRGFPGLVRVVRRPVQEIPARAFERLQENDILFLDSSHVMAIGSDVQHEFFEILPRLRPGVYIHFHDIFLPREYLREWVIDDLRFWNEQYVLQAFLMYNNAFEVVWTGFWHHLHNREQLAAAVEHYGKYGMLPGSVWLRRVK